MKAKKFEDLTKTEREKYKTKIAKNVVEAMDFGTLCNIAEEYIEKDLETNEAQFKQEYEDYVEFLEEENDE